MPSIPPFPNAPQPYYQALSALRRGEPILWTEDTGGQSLLVWAAEAVTPAWLEAALDSDASAGLLLPMDPRERVPGMGVESEPLLFRLEAPLSLSALERYFESVFGPDSLAELNLPLAPWAEIGPALTPSMAAALLSLCKRARLLPALLVRKAPLPSWHRENEPLQLLHRDLQAGLALSPGPLKKVAEARLPLREIGEARLLAFRPMDGGDEHLALIIGQPDISKPVLVRLHSSCFTGDILGSLRCDCGDQLQNALKAIAAQGGGVLLYLAQEGRNIGLVNKLRAYALQDAGHDTVAANRRLGFGEDERMYDPAAAMLNALGIRSVRLMTNNPRKIQGLTEAGIAVAERISHQIPANEHNRNYLAAKAAKLGHLL